MKGIGTLALLSLLVGAAMPAAAQDEEVTVVVKEPQNTLTVNPVGLVNGQINFEIEHATGPKTSVYGGLNFLIVQPQFGSPGGRVTGVGPELGARFFILGTAPEGVYVSPFVDAAILQNRDDVSLGYAVGGMAGLTLIPFDTLTLSLGVGTAYHEMAVTRADGSRVGVVGWAPRFRLGLGVAF